jgi:hypothetical protein
MDAAMTWDVSQEAKTLQPQRPEFSVRSVYFVTKDDPGEEGNFSILGLVRGSVGDGYGETRQGSVWQHGYWAVLDFENHMPTDEGDMRPWGGEYLREVPRELEPFAVAFWDESGATAAAGKRLTVSDFTKWTALHG